MPLVLLTAKYQHATFELPLTADGTAAFACTPISEPQIQEMTRKAMADAGYDAAIAADSLNRRLLKKHVTGWRGLHDLNGEEIPFSDEMIDQLCDTEGLFMGTQVARIRRIAREGRLEQEKN